MSASDRPAVWISRLPRLPGPEILTVTHCCSVKWWVILVRLWLGESLPVHVKAFTRVVALIPISLLMAIGENGLF